MSKPPENEDPLLQNILKELKHALKDSNIEESDGVIEELHEGIQHSLEALFGFRQREEEQVPNITIVEGGQLETPIPTEKKEADENKIKSQLSIVSSDEADDEDLEFSPMEISNVEVRVLKGEDIFPFLKNRSVSDNQQSKGLISLKEGEKQTILIAEQAYLYRVTCLEGNMTVQIQSREETIHAGQSVDISSNEIVVQAITKTTGQYFRVS